MKPAIVLLVALGLLAAVAMAFLAATLGKRANAQAAPSAQKVKVLVAVRKVEPLTALEQSLLQVREVSPKEAPAGTYSDPVQVSGRIVTMPLAEGQALTPVCFTPKGVGAEMVAKLSPGMRAVTVSLSCPASLKGLLFPGSVVDVIASFPLRGGGDKSLGEAVSTTLLESIQILAVDNEVVREPEPSAPGTDPNAKTPVPPTPSANGTCLVTFKVDSRQAEGLQLASEYGKVTLALRNPFDRNPVDQDPTLLSEGKLAGMADVLNALVARRASEEPEATPAPTPEPAPEPVAAVPAPSGWNVEVYRGAAKETVSIQ